MANAAFLDWIGERFSSCARHALSVGKAALLQGLASIKPKKVKWGLHTKKTDILLFQKL